MRDEHDQDEPWQVTYRSTPQGDLTMHAFPATGGGGRAAPGLLLLHGGAWRDGSPRQFFDFARPLAARGLSVFCPAYRVNALHGTTPFDAVEDAFAAMRFVRTRAGDLGLDARRIGAGGGFGQDRLGDRWAEVSPMHNLRPGTPPTLVLLGTEDHLIPVATAERWRDRQRELGGRSELELFDGAGHGFFNPWHEDGRHFEPALARCDAFLDSLGWLR